MADLVTKAEKDGSLSHGLFRVPAYVSGLKSDLTVGPPIDFTVYRKDQNKIASQKCLNLTDDEYSKVCNQLSNGIFKIFDSFPRFEWEDKNK